MPPAKSVIETLNLEYRIFYDDRMLEFIYPFIHRAFPPYTPPPPPPEEPHEEVKEEPKIEVPAPAPPPPVAEPPVKGKKPKGAAAPPPPPPEPEPEEEQEKPKKKREPVLFQEWDKYHDRIEAWNDVSYQILHEPLFIKQDEKDFIVLAVKEKLEKFFKGYFLMGRFSKQWFEYDMQRRQVYK